MEPDIMPDRIAQRKRQLRREAHARRREQPDKDALSRQIMARVKELAEYERAKTVMLYLDARAEVRTRLDLADLLASGKRIAVPYCVGRELAAFHLESTRELAIGKYQILEPRTDLRDIPQKQLSPHQLDLILVPGVAFDPHGARLGHGLGYYDKLLQRARQDAFLVGLAFECQIFPQIPTEPHDAPLDLIVTEQSLYVPQNRPRVT